jgi:hypothetical protein
MVVGLRKTGKRILCHLSKRGKRELLIIEQITTAKEGACQAEAAATSKAHSSLYISCIMATTQTITQKIAQFP